MNPRTGHRKSTRNEAPELHDPTERLWHSLLRTLGLVKGAMQPHFAQFGITGPQWGVLRVLHRAAAHGETSLRLSDLGGRLLIRPPSVTGAVDRLERMGLVQRAASGTDARVRRVALSAAGKSIIRKVLVGHPERIRSVFATLTMEEQRQLQRLLDRLDAHLRELRDAGIHGTQAKKKEVEAP